MPWLQIHLTTDKTRAPLMELLLESLGALSVTLGDAADEALLEPAPGELPLWQRTRVTGLFSGETDPDWLRGEINRTLQADACKAMRLEVLQDRQWERTWLEDFHPMQFGDSLWICPDGQRPEETKGVFIDLDPGLAFGSGTHPTTALCLRWLARQDLAGIQAMDFGCGSGILAVAALRLGAAQVVAVDHDPQALEATRDNARKNGVLDRMQILPSEATPELQLELMIANILAGTLIELEPLLAARTKTGGRIILSGLLVPQATEVADAYSGHFRMQPPEIEGDWALLEGFRR
jgi:ribosomal protein L11 methyltransferase